MRDEMTNEELWELLTYADTPRSDIDAVALRVTEPLHAYEEFETEEPCTHDQQYPN